MHRRDNHCEICNAAFNMPVEKFSFRRMIKTFFKHSAGPIMKHLLFSVSLMPLTHIILQQVVICMENINVTPNEKLTVKEVVLASTALMTSSKEIGTLLLDTYIILVYFYRCPIFPFLWVHHHTYHFDTQHFETLVDVW